MQFGWLIAIDCPLYAPPPSDAIQNNVPVADPLIEMMHEHAISADGSQTDLQDVHNQAAHHLIQEEQVAHHQAAHNEAQRGKQNQDVQQVHPATFIGYTHAIVYCLLSSFSLQAGG